MGKATLNGHAKLEPVFQMHYQTVPMQDAAGNATGLGHGILLTPFLGCGLPSLAVPPGALRIALSTLGSKEGWLKHINGVTEWQMQVRAKAAGLVLPHG